MDPLVIAGRFGEPVDPRLRYLHPVAHADLGANRSLDLVEILEHSHSDL